MFALLMLFIGVILHTMSSGKSLQLHLSPWYVVLVCHQYDVCESYVRTVSIGGHGGLSDSGLCVFCELRPVSFLVVGECPSVLL